MNIFRFYCLCTFIVLCNCGGVATAQVVEIPDPNLNKAIRETLTLPDQIPITQPEMLRLTRFTAKEAQIENINGLQYAQNLKSLELSVNKIQDTRRLAELIHLDFLILRDNPIRDLTPLANLTQLTYLNLAGVHITDLTPLATLTQLEELHLSHCGITDITPLANLTQLIWLNLAANQIVNISPLANLTALEKLWIESNQIVDISPLANLNRLKELQIYSNPIVDFSPLLGLSLTYLSRDEECVLPGVPVKPRLENRSLPSVFQPWDDPTYNRATLSHLDRIALHDLHWAGPRHGVDFKQTAAGYQLVGDLEKVRRTMDELRAKNPNVILLAEVRQRDAHLHTQYPEDWPYWVRGENGNLVESSGYAGIYLIDTTDPKVQDIIVQQAVAIAKCGLYDGIFFDWLLEDGGSLRDFSVHPAPFLRPPEAEREARLAILQRIRQAVPDDFLILCNQTRTKLKLSAPYVNGAFMETFQDYEGGYTYSGLAEIESTLLWSENNLREPQINCLEGWGIPTEPPDSPINQRWMRVFTTMSLTLSDGFILYNDGRKIYGEYDHQHWWYDF